MAESDLTPKLIPKTYAELRDAVLAVVFKGRLQIDLAWVLSYHEIGRHVYALYGLTPAEIKLVEESSAPKPSVT